MLSKLEEALKRAESSGQSEAKLVAEYIRDLIGQGDHDASLLMACLEEIRGWAEEMMDAVREDNDLPTQEEM